MEGPDEYGSDGQDDQYITYSEGEEEEETAKLTADHEFNNY